MQTGIPASTGNSQVIHKIQSEIRREGCLTFARFMDLALYEHHAGYYMTRPSEYSHSVETGGRANWLDGGLLYGTRPSPFASQGNFQTDPGSR